MLVLIPILINFFKKFKFIILYLILISKNIIKSMLMLNNIYTNFFYSIVFLMINPFRCKKLICNIYFSLYLLYI